MCSFSYLVACTCPHRHVFGARPMGALSGTRRGSAGGGPRAVFLRLFVPHGTQPAVAGAPSGHRRTMLRAGYPSPAGPARIPGAGRACVACGVAASFPGRRKWEGQGHVAAQPRTVFHRGDGHRARRRAWRKKRTQIRSVTLLSTIPELAVADALCSRQEDVLRRCMWRHQVSSWCVGCRLAHQRVVVMHEMSPLRT